MRLILASASPRRAEILRRASFSFEAIAANVDESHQSGELPEAFVARLAQVKAAAVATCVRAPALVLGGDTVVLVDSLILGKPADAEDAAAMLRRLSGRTHDVLTGLALLRLPDKAIRAAVECTRVTFAPLSEDEIAEYVDTGEPFGKAGAYAIQERGGRFVERIEGDYFNVMGLPVARFYRMLRELGGESGEQSARNTKDSADQ
jgi:septum formation protein